MSFHRDAPRRERTRLRPLAPGEVERILDYADRGWVATPEELRDHLSWLWRRHRSLLVA